MNWSFWTAKEKPVAAKRQIKLEIPADRVLEIKKLAHKHNGQPNRQAQVAGKNDEQWTLAVPRRLARSGGAGSKNWKIRLGIMKALGWGEDTQEQWPHFLEALYRHCTLLEMSRALGITGEMIMAEKAGISRAASPRLIHLLSGEPLRDAAARLGIPYGTAYQRYRNGYPIDKPRPRGGVRLPGK